MTFQDLNLNQKILDAIRDEGYTTPSPIQKEAIPAALAGRDILGCAQTGTGKTAAFAMPIIQRLIETESKYKPVNPKTARPLRSLILTPTRELAIQIYESFRSYGKYTPLKYSVVIGGVNQSGQVRDLTSGVDILIATPGRLLDLLYQGYVEISALEVFVLDEADRMLDMGFFDDVKKIVEIIPKNRQTMFFTATMPPQIQKLTETLLTNPLKVSVTPVSSTVDLTTQYVYLTDKFKKLDLLIWYMKNKAQNTQVLIFSRTKHGAEKLTKKLNQANIKAKALHGDKSQDARQIALSSFKNGSLPVLVATDIAARGIDVENLPLVINYELPNVPETYVHRIGRTGRAGKEGLAVSFCDREEKKCLLDIEKLIKKTITVAEDNPFKPEPNASLEPEKPRSQKPFRLRNKENNRRFNQNSGQPVKPNTGNLNNEKLKDKK